MEFLNWLDSRATVSIIIIGDEILKGQTKDTNSHFLCQELYKCGVHVARVSVIGDDVNVIAEEVVSHSKLYTYILISGGIGPTHDDVTYEGIAKAFGERLILNKDLQKNLSHLCRELNNNESAVLKMSHVPQTAEIHYTGFIPIVSVRNVFIFPGIPSYLQLAFNKLKSVFDGASRPYNSICLYVNMNEFSIVDVLKDAAREFEFRAKFGSYPDVDNKYFQVKLVLESDTKRTLVEAEAYLRSHLPQNSVVGQHPPNSESALKLMSDVCRKSSPSYDANFAQTLEKSLNILEKCFNEYPIEDICLSFNGGKDCTVLLHLTALFLSKKNLLNANKLKILYVASNQSFPEIEDFIEQSNHRYNLQMLSYKYPIKDALGCLKQDHPQIKAILLGSRLTDPHCSSLQPFQNTDSDWPQFMRVNPLIHWSYAEVWKFLRDLEVPYCSLYDKGYTSLGCQHNTFPNEQLLATTRSRESYYKPAYLLKDSDQERKGRSVKNVP